MRKNEKQLILDLCRFEDVNRARLASGLAACGDLSRVLGVLLCNRMGSAAYGVLRDCGLLGKVNREVRNTLKTVYDAAVLRQRSFARAQKKLAAVLQDVDIPYACLKGVVLMRMYPKGYRTSNDMDILTAPEHVSVIAERLVRAGFRQGYIRSGKFVPATRKDIVSSRMNRGETVPYILQVDYPFMKFLEIDINFSLDYKPSDGQTVHAMLADCRLLENGLPTLNPACFILHLCAHLYKEATTMAWVRMGRDLAIYKFTDLYLLLRSADQTLCDDLRMTAEKLGLTAECAYAVSGTVRLFEMQNPALRQLAEQLCLMHENVLDTVIDPAAGKRYAYTVNLERRLFASDRRRYLKEVGTLEAAAYV